MAEFHMHGDGCGCGVRACRYLPPDTGPIVVMQQSIEPFIVASLDAATPATLPDLRLACRLLELRVELARELAKGSPQPKWLVDWLLENILFQASLFSELTHADALKVRLETVDDDGCRRFHTDNVRHRLVCTYRGPGTEWIDPKAALAVEEGDQIDPRHVHRLERGAIALMRGSKGATTSRPGLLHRSPQIEESGIVRLLLVIDADEA